MFAKSLKLEFWTVALTFWRS